MKSFRSGEVINCISGGLHIPCIVVNDSPVTENSCLIEDPLSGIRFYVSKRELDRDLSWKRNQALKKLGI